MNSKNKTFVVAFKNGKVVEFTGRIILFSPERNTDILRLDEIIYLNAEEVLSVAEQSKKDTDGESYTLVADGEPYTFNKS